MDLVDRKAVLDEITEEYNRRREYHGLKLAWIHLAVNKVGSPWISAEERLPETDDHVLCCTRTKKGTANVVVGYYMDGLWRCGMNSNVTHWMPLPEPPEERIATAPEAPRNDGEGAQGNG